MSSTTLPSVVRLVNRVVMDPQQRQNPNQPAARGSKWGSTRSRYIVSRNGEIAILVPGNNATDLAFFSSTGVENRRFPTLLKNSTRGEYGNGSDGRDLRPGQFSSYWTNDGIVYFQSAGDYNDRGAYDNQTGASLPALAVTGSNLHAHYGLFDGVSAIWDPEFVPSWGHGGGYVNMRYRVNGVLKFVSGVNNDFNHATPLMDTNELYVTAPQYIPPEALSGGVYSYGFGSAVQQLVFNDTTGVYTKGWSWSNPDEVLTINYDGNTQSRPFCMDTSRIYLVTQPTIVGYTYPHLNLTMPSTLRVLDRSTGTQTGAVSLGNLASGNQVSFQVSLSTDKLAVLSVAMDAATPTRVTCANTTSNTVGWQYEYPANWATTDDQWRAESTRIYSTPTQICVCYARTNTTKKTVNVYLDRFSWNGGAPTRSNFSITVPGVDSKAFVDDFVILNGRAYALITYREFVAGGLFTGGGQMMVVMGTP